MTTLKKNKAMFFLFVACLLFLPTFDACAVVRDSLIEEAPGLRFENLIYRWDGVWVDIVNTTNRNMTFGGSMIFIDRSGRTVARAQILPRKLTYRSVARYNAFFTEGSGEAARKADRIMWDFGTH